MICHKIMCDDGESLPAKCLRKRPDLGCLDELETALKTIQTIVLYCIFEAVIFKALQASRKAI